MKSCPQCHLTLESGEAGEVTYAVCRSCGGCWLTAGALSHALESPTETLAEITRLFPSASSNDIFEGLPKPCPDCRTSLLALCPMPGKESSVCAFHCERCGGWWLNEQERRALVGEAVITAVIQPETVRDEAEPGPIS